MLDASYCFKPSKEGAGELANLKRHVAARQTIVNNALKANFKFGTGQRWTGRFS